jgi:hypothetical protein
VSSHFEEYKSHLCMQDKSALQANYFSPYSDLCRSYRICCVAAIVRAHWSVILFTAVQFCPV